MVLTLALSVVLAAASPSPVTGLWHARLIPVPGHDVLFDLQVEKGPKGALSAVLRNEDQTIPFSSAEWDGKTLTLTLAHLDGSLVARKAGAGLEGAYSRTTAAGNVTIPFSASRAAPPLPALAKGSASLSGTWGVQIGGPGEVEKATAILKQEGARLTGTMRTLTGDYGRLHGTWSGQNLLLTVFDGVHVYRFTGERLADGTLAGEFRSRANPPVSWNARRLSKEEADSYLPSGFTIARPKDPAVPYRFRFEDADGKTVSSEDPRFSGKPMLVVFMGTWCPNCNEEAPVLKDLHQRYAGKGLEVVSLAFEYTEDVERNRRQVKRFVERYGIPYPVLIAGTTGSAPTSASMTQLDGWQGYPTTLFLDRNHRVVKIHSGFDGPSTGEHYERLKKEMVEAVEVLLKG